MNWPHVMRLKPAACLALCCLGLSGCVAPSSSPRFHDAAAASVVLQFRTWDYIFLTQPDYRENGFQQIMQRDEVGAVFDRLHVPRNLAVVVVGWTYQGGDLDRVIADWKAILGHSGFQRVVILRPGAYGRLNGSLIVEDSTLSTASARISPRL